MSSDREEPKKDVPAEEQRGQKRKKSRKREPESVKCIKKILRDLSYTCSDSDALTPSDDGNASDNSKMDVDENSDTSSVMFVAQLRKPDPNQGPSNAFETSNSDDAYTLTSNIDGSPPESAVEVLSLAHQKVTEWLTKGQTAIKIRPSKELLDEHVSREYDFDDLSDSMFEWLLKVAEEHDNKQKEENAKSGDKKSAEGTNEQNENDETAKSSDSFVSCVESHVLPSYGDVSTTPAREIYIDPDVIEISDEEEVPQKPLPDDSEDKKPSGSGREETDAQSETDSKETNNNGTQTSMANSCESSQTTDANTEKETDGTAEHGTQDNSEKVSSEHTEDDGQNVDPSLEVPGTIPRNNDLYQYMNAIELECSAESVLSEECPNLIEWLIKD